MFEIIEEPKFWKQLTKLTGSEQKMVLDYFHYNLTTEDLIDMILNRAQPRDIYDLLEALKREQH
jgi:sugar phosphate isomerase/epimerase